MSAVAGTSRLDGLLTEIDGRPNLVGSRCEVCGTDTFPVQASCPRCGGEAVGSVALPTTGTVWTWTVQRFAPKLLLQTSNVFEPFAVAYVDLGTVRVAGRLAGKPVAAWKIGDAVRLVVGPLDGSDVGGDAYWFEPADAASDTIVKEHR